MDSPAAGVWLAPCAVFWAAVATPLILPAISPVLSDASATPRLISLVVTVCFSTAAAIVIPISLITSVTWLIADTAPWESGLDGLGSLADVLGRLGSLLGQLFDLVCDYGKAFTSRSSLEAARMKHDHEVTPPRGVRAGSRSSDFNTAVTALSPPFPS